MVSGTRACPAISRSAQLPVPPPEVRQWPSVRARNGCRQDAADDQGVVAGRDALFGAALQGGEGAAHQGAPETGPRT